MSTSRFGELTVHDELDSDKELQIDFGTLSFIYLTREQVEALRDHLTRVLGFVRVERHVPSVREALRAEADHLSLAGGLVEDLISQALVNVANRL